MEIDTLDKNILWHLDYDARVSFIDLAKTLNISKQGLNSRLNKLTDSQIIKGYYARILKFACGNLNPSLVIVSSC